MNSHTEYRWPAQLLRHSFLNLKKWPGLLAAIVLTALCAHAQTQPSNSNTSAQRVIPVASIHSTDKSLVAPEKQQPVRLPRFERPPAIDGKLDDEVWQHAAVLKDFLQITPGDLTPPSRPTEVLIGYDAKFLYFGFRCFDEPDKVRATIAKRDDVFREDNVRIFLDTFNDKRKAYVLGFNPYGVQQDGIMTEGQSTDFSVDIVMESKGIITKDGWTLEVAIPFKSLRYEAGKGKFWGLHVWRNIDRFNDEMDSWMPVSRDVASLLTQEGHITGLEDLSTERTLELIPSLTVSETGQRVRTVPPSLVTPFTQDAGRFVNQPIKVDPGLTARFSISPAITLDLAINPDFAQVEADQTVVTANQRFPIFYPEKRPFFLEGIEIFRTPLQALHTRAIVDPDIAAKLTGRRGPYTFGLLLASDSGPGNFVGDERLEPNNRRFLDKNAYVGVLRIKRNVGTQSSVGLIATTYNFIERHNQLGGFDGRFKLGPQRSFNFQVLGTTSRRFFRDADLGRSIYRTGNGFRYYYEFDQTGRNFGYSFDGTGQTRDYRADLGFTRRTNTNFEELNLRYNSTQRPRARLISWNTNTWLNTNFDWQGRMQKWTQDSYLTLNLQKQTYIGAEFITGYERIFEEEFGAKRTATRQGAFAGPDSERSTHPISFQIYGGSAPNQKYRGSFELTFVRNAFDFDFGSAPKFPRVSPAALALGQDAPLDPGPGNGLRFDASFRYQPTPALLASIDYTKDRLARRDTRLTAYDDNIYALRMTYQFTRFIFIRGRLDYSTLSARARGQFLLGWTPNPGTSFYAGYNDDLTRNGYNPFTDQFEPGLRRNGRTFFLKMSYLIRRSF